MRKRCKTCVHWDVEGGNSWGECLMAGSTDGGPNDRFSLAVAYDHESVQGVLQTADTFGCVQWEGKGKGQ